MARSELTSKEHDLLANIAEYNRGPHKGTWLFNGRKISDADLTGLELHGATVNDVEFENVTLDKANVSNSNFSKVTFNGGRARAATFVGTTFVTCDFLGYESKETVFRQCIFRGCHMEKWELEGAHFEDCTWENCNTDMVELADNSLVRQRFIGGMLKDLRFYRMRFEDVSFSGSKMSYGIFQEISGEKLVFQGGSIEDTGFSATPDFSGLEFNKAQLKQTRFSRFNARDIRVSECPVVHSLTFTNSRLRRFSLEKCPEVYELHFFRSQITDTRLEGAAIDSLVFAEGTVDGQTVLKDLQLGFCDWAEGHLVGLKLENCSFNGRLVLSGAVIEQLKTDRVTYGPKFKATADKVQYKDGARLGSP